MTSSPGPPKTAAIPGTLIHARVAVVETGWVVTVVDTTGVVVAVSLVVEDPSPPQV
jgi:hypothetical protein